MFGIFGRSQELQSLDRALRSAGILPRGVPEAVKLTTLKQLKEFNLGRSPDAHALKLAAELIAYCLLGPEEFRQTNGASRAENIESRLGDALETGLGLDARLVLLTLHARLIHPGAVQRFHLSSE
jgi:hypothetical protein